MALVSNADSIPEALIQVKAQGSQAIYLDVNPVPGPGKSELLLDAAAVFASIRNLLLCPPGARGRIFQPDYFSGVYYLLQEPMDDVTANQISSSLYQALQRWEPRVRLSPSDIQVVVNNRLPGYLVQITITILGKTKTSVINIPLSGNSFGA